MCHTKFAEWETTISVNKKVYKHMRNKYPYFLNAQFSRKMRMKNVSAKLETPKNKLY